MMKTLLLLGAGSDVGKACAYRFACEGFNILLASRNVDEDQRMLAADLSIRYNISAENLHFDALQTGEHESFYRALKIKPDVVISAFGYLGNQEKATTDPLERELITFTNYNANVSILSIIANEMEGRKAGTIIGISSVAGERIRKKNYVYGASKAALTAFLEGLRARLAPSGVHIAVIKPGFIKTKMTEGMQTPPMLTATPEQVADAIWKAYCNKTKVKYILPVWRYIMFIIRLLPNSVLQKANL